VPRPSRTVLLVIVAVLVFWLTPAAVVFGIAVLVTTSGTGGQACGSGGPRDPQTNLDSEQLANAQTVIATVQGLLLPPRAAQIAVATAMQESSLRNLNYGDAAGPGSRGLYQQQIQFYGVTVPTDPVLATKAFLSQVVAIPNWQLLPLTQVAATVQRPRTDLRGAYAQWEGAASTLVQRFWPGAAGGIGAQSGTVLAAPCAGNGGAGLPGASTGAIPAGYQLPTTGQGAAAVRFAVAQVGKPYVWGGVGPNGYDCSGLMLKAWAAAGVAIPRTSQAQSQSGTPVPGLADLQPGDLLFIAGADGSPASPGHVGMYIGATAGVAYLVQAPQTGQSVQVDPLSRWKNVIVAIRRPLDSATSQNQTSLSVAG
jgi:cell wall-associated NlpC family hydrolase